jgi:predicted RNA-binding Zn-ribbon protein involved in translation (DUF1610 family)
VTRKYKQKGYQQDAEPGERSPASPRLERREGPRGRGLGAPTATTFRCARCGRRLEPEGVARDAVCPGCGNDLHSCTNCSHFDASARLECRQPIASRVARKAARNECDLFQARLTQEFARESQSPNAARKAFDDLFDL